jgi:hypothetical protein
VFRITAYEGRFAPGKVTIRGFTETCSEGEFEKQRDLDTTPPIGVRLRPTR